MRGNESDWNLLRLPPLISIRHKAEQLELELYQAYAPILCMMQAKGKSHISTRYCTKVDETMCYSVPCSTFSPDISLMAAGFAESYIRIWSLKGEKLKGLRSDFQASSIRDCGLLSQFPKLVLINIYCSWINSKNKRKGRKLDSEAHRPQWSSILAILRPSQWLCRASQISAVSVCRCYGEIMVVRNHDQCRRVSWSSKSRMGYSMESHGHLFCDR